MAKQLNIDILARDKTKQALNGVQGNLDKTKQSIFNLRNALIGLGAGAVLRSFVNVGKEVESLQVRFKFLFGSVEEGQVAFDNLSKFAGRVPFSLEEISRASGNLAVVAKDANDLNRILEITGNVAAVTGLDFETTSSQIQRAFSGGIGAADLFRERGVRALLGFQNGAKVTAEETVARFEELFAGDGQFAKATDDLATTLEGTLSMIGDKYFNFQKDIAKGFFDELKSEFGDLNQALEDNKEEIEAFANAIGFTLAKSITGLGTAVSTTTSLIDQLNVSTRDLILDMPLGFGIEQSLRDLYPEIDNNIDRLDLFIARLLGFERGQEGYKGAIDTLIDAHMRLNKSQDAVITSTDGVISKLGELREISLTAMEISPVNIEEDDIFEKLRQIRDKTGVGLIKQIKAQKRKEIAALEEANDLGLLTDEEYLKQKEKLNEYYEDRITKAKEDEISTRVKLEKQGQEQIIGAVGDALSRISGLNKDAFRAYQAFQIAMATINTYRAVSNALATYPFPLNIGVAGAELARGLATVAQIRSAAPPRQTGGRVFAGQPYTVGENGRETFVPESNGTILPNGSMGRAVNVNFTINAVDTRGFRALLRNERGTIVNMINQAVTDKGREAVI